MTNERRNLLRRLKRHLFEIKKMFKSPIPKIVLFWVPADSFWQPKFRGLCLHLYHLLTATFFLQNHSFICPKQR